MRDRVEAVFFVRVDDPSQVDKVSFYAHDIEALRELLGRVVVVTRYRHLIRYRPRLVFVWWWTWALPVVLMARLARIPVLITGTFNWDESNSTPSAFGRRPMWQRWMIRSAAHLADRNLFPSCSEARRVGEGLGLSAEQVGHFPHVVRVADSPDDNSLTRDGGDEPVFLSLAWSGSENLKRKCVYEVIAAFERLAVDLPQVRLVLAGNEGEGLPGLRQRVSRSLQAGRIDVLGRVSEAEKDRLLSSAVAFVSPSQYEGFGVAIAEAAATGTPVITSPVGAVPEVLGHDGAQFVSGTDVDEISRAMRRVIEEPHAVAVLAENARSRVSAYTTERKRSDVRRELRALGLLASDSERGGAEGISP